jgi:indole-3-glycerol phosphate synthase
VQAFSGWTPPGGTLGTIVREAELRAEVLLRRSAELIQAARIAPAAPSLLRALRGGTVGVVAEVKRRSPSKGAIAPGLDAVAQADAYARGGAAAVSILTEPAHFGGSIEDLRNVRSLLKIPALKKDFHVTVIQLVEARLLGSSAALVIARALSPQRLKELMEHARMIGLEVLVEVRDEWELERALHHGASMVGVNNRNLETLEIEPGTAERVIPKIPPGVIAVAESGVRTRDDVERYAGVGADAVLVGSALSASPDPAAATEELVGVTRHARHG